MKQVAISALTNIFFPEQCSGCGSSLPEGNGVYCLYCEAELPRTQYERSADNPIERIFYGRVRLETASAHLYFTRDSPFQHALHRLKYGSRRSIGTFFGRKMGQALAQSARFASCDLIVPLPLFRRRERKRGFNQSQVLAEGIASVLNLPVVNDLVYRLRATDTQTTKNRIDRWANLDGCFRIRQPILHSFQHVLLVDDVITTGASAEACAEALLSIPGTRVSLCCLAHRVRI